MVNSILGIYSRGSGAGAGLQIPYLEVYADANDEANGYVTMSPNLLPLKSAVHVSGVLQSKDLYVLNSPIDGQITFLNGVFDGERISVLF